MVFRLSGPGLMHDAGCDGSLSGICQHLHDWKHGVEMLLAPKRNLVVASYGVGILPQVQMESPILWSRQCTVKHVDLYLEFHILEILSRNGQCPFVFPCAGIGWNPYVQPDRLRRAGFDILYLYNIQNIGNE